MFDQIFPPEFLNAGYMSMAENDILGRVDRACELLYADWGRIIPSRDIIDQYLMREGVEPFMLPPKALELLDNFDIVEG